MQCSRCQREVADGSRFCASCGAQVGSPDASTFTAAPRPGPSPSTDPIDNARFIPGTILASRYRIVSLLGRGGMGEVYRADDLKLGQAVALKFLPERLAHDPDRLARFHQEVRVARQVAHPNVCRVYDIGEADGQHFLTMEYVDGEDVASLLRRIGRLPSDKAIQVGRQLCAGLAAAHERGVLHRDLKPANVMLDSHGRVRIADFGLAALADQQRDAHTRAGTPAYMAPEQIDGRGATTRSDVYALGLILYEIFTGKPALSRQGAGAGPRSADSSLPTNPSNVVADIDPIVERAILRCLETDPAQRPPSAFAVAAALPGADPLAAAMAAGETPSPDMVAAAGGHAGLSPTVGVVCLIAIAVGLLPIAWFSRQTMVTGYQRTDKSPEMLAERAATIARNLGYIDRPADYAYGFTTDTAYLQYIAAHDSSRDRWQVLKTRRPAALLFWYRQSRQPLVPGAFAAEGRVRRDDPPAVPGAVSIETDPEGRLTHLLATPMMVDDGRPIEGEPNWDALFVEAGLPPAGFTRVDQKTIPPVHTDSRAAWDGHYPERPEIPLHVEAGAYGGRAVYFAIVAPWDASDPTADGSGGGVVDASMNLTFNPLILLVAIGIAYANLRSGRVDRRGATRLALFLGTSTLVGTMAQAHSIAAMNVNLSIAAASALGCWISYLAFEPQVRRMWPHTMIGWSRLLAGQLRDWLVGRDILVGTLAGILLGYVTQLGHNAPAWLGLTPLIPRAPIPGDQLLMGGRWTLSAIAGVVSGDVIIGVFFFLALFVLHLIFRRHWLATTALGIVLFAVGPVSPLAVGVTVMSVGVAALFTGGILFLILRFGLLATIVCGTVSRLTTIGPLSFDSSVPYAASTYSIVALVLLLAAYGFRTSLAGRPVLGPAFIGERTGAV